MPADEFVAVASHPHVLSNPLLKTQHFVGTTRWEKVGDSKNFEHHQMRVAHQKNLDAEMKEVVVKGHGHGSAMVTYRKIDGEWKSAGISRIYDRLSLKERTSSDPLRENGNEVAAENKLLSRVVE